MLSLALLGPLVPGILTANGPPADLVFQGGAIYTVNAQRSWAQAIAIRDVTIQYVGTHEGVKAHIGTGTRVVPLDGKMVLPGFHDIHVHPIEAGMAYTGCSLFELDSQSKYVEAVARCAAANPDEDVIDSVPVYGDFSLRPQPKTAP